MTRTPDAFPGDRLDEGLILDDRSSGEDPTLSGGMRYVSGSFSMRDTMGLFNPRSSIDSPYLLIGSATSSLPNSREFQILTSSGFLEQDNGPGLAYQLFINDNIVATISGSSFIGPIIAAGGISGSFQNLSDGTPAFIGVGATGISTGTNGQIFISSSVGLTNLPCISSYEEGGGQTFTTIPTTINLDNNHVIDNTVFTRSVGEITVNSDGVYDISAELACKNLSGNSRTGVVMWIEINELAVPGTRSSLYLRGPGTTGTITFTLDISSGDIVRIRASRQSGSATVEVEPSGVRLRIKKVN